MNVPGHIIEILGRATTSGSRLVLVGQLDRKDYSLADKALQAAGGRWDRKAKAHVFAGDAAEAIEPILLSGEIVSEKAKLGQFWTPGVVAERVIDLARIKRGMLTLEPSAGRGALALAAVQARARVDCIEIDPLNAEALRHFVCNDGIQVVREIDFLSVAPEPFYDRVVMNPPFARQADIYHVFHAARFLKPGGRLVAIMSASVTFRQNTFTVGFRKFLDERGAKIEPLPAGAFKASGTTVNAVIVSFGGAT